VPDQRRGLFIFHARIGLVAGSTISESIARAVIRLRNDPEVSSGYTEGAMVVAPPLRARGKAHRLESKGVSLCQAGANRFFWHFV
jgi:hypothetical protein